MSLSKMVAERSLNCSLVSLPRTEVNLQMPLCGPLEGLALMYILKEQGALVAYNQEMLSKVSPELKKYPDFNVFNFKTV